MQTINLRSIARVIGMLTDQISDEDPFHARRIAVMAWRVGRQLGLSLDDLDDLLVAALIHDCGISSPAEHTAIITKIRWDTENDHCLRGAGYLVGCAPLEKFGAVVRYHHTPWSDLSDTGLSARDKLMSNILFCCDRSYVAFYRMCLAEGIDHVINFKTDLIADVVAMASDAFSPEVRDAFAAVARTDGFWMALYPDFIDSSLSPLNRRGGDEIAIPFAQMRTVATLISRLVDAKSHYTHEHSERVSTVASRLAMKLGLDSGVINQLEIAALLHDVGKQQAPEMILLKPGALSARERAVIKRHTIGSEVALGQLFPDSPIVDWAAHHHEKLDGSGYPYGLTASQLDIESRVLTTADIFQALTQSRPYRGPTNADDAIAIMETMVEGGELDGEVFHVLKSNRAEFYIASTG